MINAMTIEALLKTVLTTFIEQFYDTPLNTLIAIAYTSTHHQIRILLWQHRLYKCKPSKESFRSPSFKAVSGRNLMMPCRLSGSRFFGKKVIERKYCGNKKS